MELPKIVSLFSGAGGLDLGFSQAGFPIVFALDKSSDAIRTHQRNFPNTCAITVDLTQVDTQKVLWHINSVLENGESIGVIGGPPCQGFSRANSLSYADDPRNQLPFIYLNIIEELQKKYMVKFVLFENVQGILDSKHSTTFNAIKGRFSELGLYESVQTYSALDYGVPQTRTRVIIAAFDSPQLVGWFEPEKVKQGELTVRKTISNLPDPVFYKRGLDPDSFPVHPNHWTMVPRSKKFQNPDTKCTSGRCFRKLKWDEPSPTVAYGHREIHVHPSGKRRLSIYEAMLLQGFPADFVLEGSLSSQVEQVSNAVPPPLGKALAQAIKTSLLQEDRG